MTQSIRSARRIHGIGNGVRNVKPRSLSRGYYLTGKDNKQILESTEDKLGSKNIWREIPLVPVFPNVSDSPMSLVERDKSVLDRSFFKKEKPEEVISESGNNSPAPIV